MSIDVAATLEHPEHGSLPALCLLDCVFSMTPAGRILHRHIEEFDVETGGDGGRRLVPNGRPPAPERARCQVIPPFVNAFRRARSAS